MSPVTTKTSRTTGNFGIMAHIDAGKTTTTERILYYTGKSHKIGEVHDGCRDHGLDGAGAGAGDHHHLRGHHRDVERQAPSEHHRHPRASSTSPSRWSASLRVLDGAVAVLDGNQGVEPQTETVWRQADRYDVPRIVFVNKMDKIGASFEDCVESIRDRLGVKAVPIQLPIGSESTFKGIIDLVRMKAVVWDNEALGANYRDEEIPADLKDAADEARHFMVENSVELDDEAMESYLNGDEVTEETLKKCLRKAVLTGAFYPILCGSAFKNKGVQPLLDAVVDYLPSPVDIPPTPGFDFRTEEPVTRQASDEEALSVLAFKIMDDPFVGSLTFCRIYSGKLESGMGLINSSRDRRERVGRMLLMHANNREDIKEAFAGDIVALAGLKDTRTGDTLCDPNKSPVILQKMDFPDPVIEIAIEPKSKADQEKLGVALQKLAAEDPTFRVSTDPESGQTRLKGMGELHLDIKVDILEAQPTRWKPTSAAKAAGGLPRDARPQDRHRLHPQEADRRFRSVRAGEDHLRTGGAGRRLLVREQDRRRQRAEGIHPSASRRGLESVKENGLLAGFPVIDFKATLDRWRVPRRRLQRAGVRRPR